MHASLVFMVVWVGGFVALVAIEMARHFLCISNRANSLLVWVIIIGGFLWVGVGAVIYVMLMKAAGRT